MNGQDQIVQSRNYCNSFIRVEFIDEIEREREKQPAKDYHLSRNSVLSALPNDLSIT